MNWGHSIVLGFILFAAFVFTLVFRMVMSGNDLVKAKYFKTGPQINQELKIREASRHIDTHFHIQPLAGEPGVLEIRFDSLDQEISGTVQLICLSDDKADQTIPLSLVFDNHGKHQKIKLLRPRSGTWLAELTGKVNEEPLLLKKQFTL